MAVAQQYMPGKRLMNYGGTQGRMVSNRLGAAARGVGAGSVTKPTSRAAANLPNRIPPAISRPPVRVQRPAPAGGMPERTPGAITGLQSATPTTPKPTKPAGIGKEWKWKKGQGWVAVWISGIDPRNSAYWAAYTPAAAAYEKNKAALEAQFTLGSAAQRESALRNLYSSNAALASRGLYRSGGLAQARDVQSQANAAALDALSRQYGSVAQQDLANQWYQQQLALMEQAARDYQKQHPASQYLSQYLKG